MTYDVPAETHSPRPRTNLPPQDQSMKLLLPSLLLGTLTALSVRADDWPCFRGPSRDGRSAEKGLLASWPKEGPSLVWKIKDAGEGLSGVSIVGGKLYTMGQLQDGQYTLCYDLTDGRQLWKTRNAGTYENGFGNGPRCTPTVNGDVIFAVG